MLVSGWCGHVNSRKPVQEITEIMALVLSRPSLIRRAQLIFGLYFVALRNDLNYSQ